jgi:hypothetical protein
MIEMEYMLADSADECERAARFIRNQTPETLRAWAARIESGFAPNGVCLPAMGLERAAANLRTYRP